MKIKGLHIEPTNICTLKCAECSRTKFIKQWPQHWKNHNIDLDDLDRFLDIDKSPTHFRWIMFLDDWAHGQVCQMGDEFIKWQKGDVITWNVKDTPHALANLGYDTRFLVIVKAKPISS